MSRCKYKEIGDAWVRPIYRGYKLVCCDCHLVHQLDFRVHNKRVEFRVRRDNRATAQFRRFRGGAR
jgi:hypothetical protein